MMPLMLFAYAIDAAACHDAAAAFRHAAAIDA